MDMIDPRQGRQSTYWCTRKRIMLWTPCRWPIPRAAPDGLDWHDSREERNERKFQRPMARRWETANFGRRAIYHQGRRLT